MRLRQLIENLNRTGQGKAAVVGWGRGMGHKGHMYLASSVITQANELGADPYFVVSRTVGKDDPIKPEEKMQIYKKVFPEHGHIFHTATDEMPDLTRVLAQLDRHGYTDVTVVVGADQVKGLSYVKQYNGVPDKAGKIPFSFNSLNVIARQETNDPSREEEGPRATPMRDVLMDPNKSEDEKFAVWRDAMNSELSDDEVLDLMHKAHARMQDFSKPKVRAKKEKAVAEAENFNGEYDDEAGMFKNDLQTIQRVSTHLEKAISDNENLPEWCQSNIAQARGMIVNVMDYMISQHENGIKPEKEKATAEGLASVLAKSSDIPPDIMMLVQKIKNNVQLRPDELSKLKTFKTTRDMYKTDKSVGEEAAGVGIVTKQNSTADVGPGTLRKNLKAFNLTK